MIKNAVIRGLEPERDQEALDAVVSMAAAYPLPHNVLGTSAAPAYVRQVARRPDGKWYGLFVNNHILAAAYLGLYGHGNGRCHSLWKIRHPLAVGGGAVPTYWTDLFEHSVGEAVRIRPETAKVVIFLSEHERQGRRAAEQAGFVVEGCLRDYYRLEEQCLIYGRTGRYPSHTATTLG